MTQCPVDFVFPGQQFVCIEITSLRVSSFSSEHFKGSVCQCECFGGFASSTSPQAQKLHCLSLPQLSPSCSTPLPQLSPSCSTPLPQLSPSCSTPLPQLSHTITPVVLQLFHTLTLAVPQLYPSCDYRQSGSMASFSQSYNPLLVPVPALRPHSYSAVESYLSADSSVSTSAFSSSSSTIASSSSSSSTTSTLTPPEPVSPGNSRDGGIPLWKTLVRPRRWRFVQSSRIGGSLDRDRARQESTARDTDSASCLGLEDENIFISSEKLSPGPSGEKTELKSVRSSADRTKSESDIGLCNATGERRSMGFKTRAERFNLQDSKVSTSQPRAMSRSQTMPPTGRSILLTAGTHTLPRGPTLVDFSRRSRSSSRMDGGHKSVTFSEPEKVELSSPAKSDSSSSSNSCSDKSADSPSRCVTLNAQESTVKVSFSRPPVPAKPSVLEKSAAGCVPGRHRTCGEKPEVPAKPARLCATANGPTEISTHAITPTTPALSTAQIGSMIRTSSYGPKSPSSAVFNSEFTVVDGRQSETTKSKSDPSMEFRPKSGVTKCENLSNELSNCRQLKTNDKTEEITIGSQLEDINDNVKERAVGLTVVDVAEKNRNEESDAAVPRSQHSSIVETITPPVAETNKKSAKNKDITTKKMVKVKGDKKAEEKAAKAKKEDKAKEKEQKSKKKTSDSPDNEKGRIRLFPWRVEFLAKEKSHRADTISSALKNKDNKLKRGFRKTRTSAKDMVPSAVCLSGAEEGAQPRAEGGPAEDLTAFAKKNDRSESAGSSSNKDGASLHPLQGDDDQQDGLVEIVHHKLQTPVQQPSSHHHPTRQSSSSPPPPHVRHQQPEHLHHQQQRHHHHHHHHQQQQQQHQHQQHHHHHQQQQQQQEQHYHQQQCQYQQPPRQPTPKPRSVDDCSSSDHNSDMDSWYGSLPRRPVMGRGFRFHLSDSEAMPPQVEGGGRRKAVPRRHTVGGAQIQEHIHLVEDTNRKREAFYEMLASRYPQYADKITGLSSYHQPVPTAVERTPHPRDVVRRRAAVPAVSHYTSRSLEYDDPGTMSDIELSSFQRGGCARASMPIVRSASASLERPIGLVFLVYGDETKKALLPNEVTSLVTVRALFVRAFPQQLTMDFLDSPKRKIYILDPATSIFFQLEDLKDIGDRTVLKIHQCDSDEPQHVKCPIEIRGRTAQPARPATLQGALADHGPHFHQQLAKARSLPVSSGQTTYQDYVHRERQQWEQEQKQLHDQMQRRSRSLTPQPADHHPSLPTGSAKGCYSHPPDHLPTSDRGQGAAHLNSIPENPRLLSDGFRQSAGTSNAGNHQYDDMGGRPHGEHHHAPVGHHPVHHTAPPVHPGRVLSPPTPIIYESAYPAGNYSGPHPNHFPQAFVSHSMQAPMAQGPLRATGPSQHQPHDMRGHSQGGPVHRQTVPLAAISNAMYDHLPPRAQPSRATPDRDVMPPRPHSTSPIEVGRMDRMEAQIASLAAWVHQVQTSPPVEGAPPARRNSSRSTSSAQSEGTDTYPASTASKHNGDRSNSAQPGVSDIPATCSEGQQSVTVELREKISAVHCGMLGLRAELQGLRRLEQLNQEAVREAFSHTWTTLKKVIGAVPGAEEQLVRQQRLEVNAVAEAYRYDRARVERELSDLELSVEELKQDVLARRCRINMTDVEGLALVLSNITKALADLKGQFPKVYEKLRKVMAAEMEIVVKEEKFLKEEPQQIEAALKRCKKLTSTLYTLKRLATVQDTRPLHVPSVALESREVGEDEKMAILESIRAMVPDHDIRLHSMEAADASRERKKKLVTQHESLKLTRCLQAAGKSLKPAEPHSAQHDALTAEPHCSSNSSDSSEIKKSEPPSIPSKPARLMLTSEGRHTDALLASSSASVHVPAVTHTVTVTSQISGSGEKKEVESKSTGRHVFFSSTESCPVLMSASIEKSPMVTISAATSLASGVKVVTAPHCPAPLSPRFCVASGGPPQAEPAEDTEDSLTDRMKRIPPPPPPRKSSARYPYGIGPLSPQSPVEPSAGSPFVQQQSSGEKSPGATSSKAYTPTSPTKSGPLSSTPKPPTPQKPPGLTKLFRTGSSPAGMMGGSRRPPLQHQRVGQGGTFTTFIPPVPAEVVTNSTDPLEDSDPSGSDSMGSTTSLDSQKGAASLVRANSTPHWHVPRPFPPQSGSTLKEGNPSSQQTGGRTHVLSVSKPLTVGNMTVQLNGMQDPHNT